MPHGIDPEITAELAATGNDPTTRAMDLNDLPSARETARKMFAALPMPDTTGMTIEERTVPGPSGIADLTLRIYRPDRPESTGVLYEVHGGAYVLGDLDLSHVRNIELVRDLGAVLVSVDYRLAPEHPFPDGLEDCYAGLVWLAAHAGDLGADPDRIVLHGLSAGGGLTAALALLARDRRGPTVAFQYLGIPELDDRLGTRSMRDLGGRDAFKASWQYYLGPHRQGADDIPSYAAPARARDLSGLPPAYVSVMENDPLRDEGIAYATALLAAGVQVELHLFPGTFHSSSTFAPEAEVSRRERNEEVAVLRRALR